jgi:NAD-dependent oxidoreductase involved in siderophore biosynthesis
MGLMSSAERVVALVPGRGCNFTSTLWKTLKESLIDIDFLLRALHKCVNERVMAASTAHLCVISEATFPVSVKFCDWGSALNLSANLICIRIDPTLHMKIKHRLIVREIET